MKNLVDADIENIKEIKENIANLSNDYYAMIPETGYTNSVLPFLDKKSLILKKIQLL